MALWNTSVSVGLVRGTYIDKELGLEDSLVRFVGVVLHVSREHECRETWGFFACGGAWGDPLRGGVPGVVRAFEVELQFLLVSTQKSGWDGAVTACTHSTGSRSKSFRSSMLMRRQLVHRLFHFTSVLSACVNTEYGTGSIGPLGRSTFIKAIPTPCRMVRESLALAARACFWIWNLSVWGRKVSRYSQIAQRA